MIKLTLSVHSPGKPGKKKMLKFTDDLEAVIEKHFPESGFTLCGGPEPVKPQA